MSNSQSRVTIIAITVAVVCAGWAIYATRHVGRSAAMPGGPPGAAAGRPRGPAGGAGMPVPVVSQPAHEEAVVNELKALGTARANEAVEIVAKTSNIVTALKFRDGERVSRGAVLVELDSAQARADLAVASAALTESESQYRRGRELLPTQALSKSQFDQIEATRNANAARVDAARARLEDTFIRAPFAGRVGLRRVSVGSLVGPGTVITTLDDTSVMKIDFTVPENLLTALRPGLVVQIDAAAYSGKRFAGRVAGIDSRVDATSRAVTVRAEASNVDGLLKPGMFVNITLQRDQRSAIVLPEEALVPEQSRQYVFVVAGGKALKREVHIGARRPGSVEIIEGLRVGERVITEGTVIARDGGPVRDLARDLPPPAPAPTSPKARP